MVGAHFKLWTIGGAIIGRAANSRSYFLNVSVCFKARAIKYLILLTFCKHAMLYDIAFNHILKLNKSLQNLQSLSYIQ